MAPELVEAFIVEFNAELRRAAQAAEGERAGARHARGEVERKIAGILRAIEDGAYPTLTSRLTTLEAEKAARRDRAGVAHPAASRLAGALPQ